MIVALITVTIVGAIVFWATQDFWKDALDDIKRWWDDVEVWDIIQTIAVAVMVIGVAVALAGPASVSFIAWMTAVVAGIIGFEKLVEILEKSIEWIFEHVITPIGEFIWEMVDEANKRFGFDKIIKFAGYGIGGALILRVLTSGGAAGSGGDAEDDETVSLPDDASTSTTLMEDDDEDDVRAAG